MDGNKLSFQRQLTINKQKDPTLQNRQKNILKRLKTIKQLERLYTLTIKKPEYRESNTSMTKKRVKFQSDVHVNVFNKTPVLITETITKDSTIKDNSIDRNNNNDINKIENKKNNNISGNMLYRKNTSSFGQNLNINKNLKKFFSKPTMKLFKKKETLNPMFFRTNPFFNKKKLTNPLEIAEEDKIFDQLNTEKNVNVNKKKPLFVKNLTDDERILEKMYKLDQEYFDKLKKVKKLKDSLDLEQYQKSLLYIIGSKLSKEHFKKLERSFNKIRENSKVNIETSNDFIKSLERKEKKIIKNINYTSERCELMMRTTGDSIEFKSFTLPKVKFYRIIKIDKRKKNRHYFNFDPSDSESQYYQNIFKYII